MELPLCSFERDLPSLGVAKLAGYWPGMASSHPRCHPGGVYTLLDHTEEGRAESWRERFLKAWFEHLDTGLP